VKSLNTPVIYGWNHKPKKTGISFCSRDHAITGYNVNDSGGCRACSVSRFWAKRNNKFNDDPIVLARADRLYEEYKEIDSG